jgi:hypothetical protein
MPNTQNIHAMFPWLTRVGIGRRFPGMPIGWYQIHQMCAIGNIEHRAKVKLGLSGMGYEVKASGGEVYARPGGSRKGTRFVRIGSTDELFKNADDCARGDKNAEFRGARRRRRRR